MSGIRLQAQFSALYLRLNGKDSETTLHDMADVFCCTPRNARILLHKMALQGWVAWDPAVGRGKRSRLTFHRSESDLQMKRVRGRVRAGQLEVALEELNQNTAKLAKLIQNQLGISKINGKRILRLPYYRPFPCLNPAKPLRSAERHLIAHIFNGLTKINPNTSTLEPDLAHHWEAITKSHWRFYLRPAITFHDGSLLEVDDVIFSLSALKNNPYYSHIERIEAAEKNVIDVYLHRADCYFARALAFHLACIYSRKSARSKQQDRFPVGTGPYFVAQNNERHILLKAHDHYFGFRPLTDEIEIWVFDNKSVGYLHRPSLEQPIALNSEQNDDYKEENKRFELDEGCHYLLLNRHNGIAKNPAWAAYLCQQLSSMRVLPYLTQKETTKYRLITAYGLLPGWIHTRAMAPHLPPPSKAILRLAYDADSPLLSLIANALQAALWLDEIELVVDIMSYKEIMQAKQTEKIDIWLSSMSLGELNTEAVLLLLMSDKHFFAAMPTNEFATIKEKMALWHEEGKGDFNIECLGRSLVARGQIIPLLHHWVEAVDFGDVDEISANKIKWSDFSSLWNKPTLLS